MCMSTSVISVYVFTGVVHVNMDIVPFPNSCFVYNNKNNKNLESVCSYVPVCICVCVCVCARSMCYYVVSRCPYAYISMYI